MGRRAIPLGGVQMLSVTVIRSIINLIDRKILYYLRNTRIWRDMAVIGRRFVWPLRKNTPASRAQ